MKEYCMLTKTIGVYFILKHKQIGYSYELIISLIQKMNYLMYILLLWPVYMKHMFNSVAHF